MHDWILNYVKYSLRCQLHTMNIISEGFLKAYVTVCLDQPSMFQWFEWKLHFTESVGQSDVSHTYHLYGETSCI